MDVTFLGYQNEEVAKELFADIPFFIPIAMKFGPVFAGSLKVTQPLSSVIFIFPVQVILSQPEDQHFDFETVLNN